MLLGSKIETIDVSFLRSRGPLDTHTRESEKGGHPPQSILPASQRPWWENPSRLKEATHTGKDPASGPVWAQGQTKQDDWRGEARKDRPHAGDLNDLQSTCGSLPVLLFLTVTVTLPLSPPP